MIKRVPRIETERLTLRGIEEGDTELIVKWRSDPEAYPYFTSPHPITAREHQRWFEESYCADANRLDWLGRERGSGLPAGLFHLRREGTASKEVEVSYLVAPETRRRGYAREAVEALLRWARQAWSAEAALAEVHRDNAASRRFAESLNFRRLRERGNFIIYGREL